MNRPPAGPAPEAFPPAPRRAPSGSVAPARRGPVRRRLPSSAPLLLAGLLALPGLLSAQASGGGGGSPASNPQGWYLEAGGSMSMERSPLGTRWRDASESLALRLDLPGVRGFRPTFEGGRASHRDRDCFNQESCPTVTGWTLRAGVITGDILPRDSFVLAPYLRGDLGAFVGPDATTFSPSLRVGLLVRATPRIVPRIEAGQVRYPDLGSVWELGAGLRVTLR